MKPVNKVLMILIGLILSYWAVCIWALDTNTNLSAITAADQGSGTDLLYIVNDPNGTPTPYAIGLDELSWGITRLGTITTGIWNAGVVTSSGTITSSGTFDVTGANPLVLGSADVTSFTITTDGTGNAEFIIPNDVIGDADIDWGSGAGQIDLADIPGGISGASVWDFGGATTFEIPSDESADATLTALGQVHIRGDEDRISAHLGAGGEIAGEATISFLKRMSVTLDPGSSYNSGAYVNLGPILAKQYPNGIIIDYWQVTCHLDPDVEMDLDLCYSVNDFDLADPNVVDVMDTTTGRSSEDTDANINAGAAIPAGVYLYLRFGADPEGTCVMLTVTILYHAEED